MEANKSNFKNQNISGKKIPKTHKIHSPPPTSSQGNNMGDDSKRSNRKPVSLNDNHYRLLQELSASSKNLPSSSANDLYEEEEGKSMKVEGRRRLFKASNLETFVDEDIDHDGNLLKITDQDKPKKVKIKGRRRLCKLSSRDDENDEVRGLEDDMPSFAGIADFDSPQASKPVGDGECNLGVSEIRDILNDLSSRLDFLSIEKRKVPENIDKQAGDKEKKIDLPDFASADSSFSRVSDPSDASLAANKNVGCYVESAVDEEEEVFDSCSESEMVVGVDEQHKVEQGRVGESVASVEEFSVHNVQEKGRNEWCNEFEDDDFVTSAYETKKTKQNLMQNKHKLTKERLRYAGRSFIHHLRDQEEDEDDDCVVLNVKSSIVEEQTCGDMLKGSSSFSKVDNGSIDLTNDSVGEDDGLFTMAGPHATYKLPGKIAKILYPHQREGLKWLWSLHCQGKGGILGDDMGLGKTMQISGYLAGLFHSRLIKRVMIVAPKTLLPHWIKELSAVGLSKKIREYFGTSARARQYELQYVLQDKGILLTTYDIVRNNSKSLKGAGYFADEESEDDFAWDYMILDEGHIIKNPSTQRAKSLLEIPSVHRIIISGTPLQNNLKELWALFNFSCPGLLGDNKGFKDKYEQKILRGNEKNASQREKLIGSTVAKELREHIQPFFLRRLKSEVFKENDTSTVKLSKKNELIVWLRLTTCQQRLYEAFLQSEIVLSAFDGSPLAALTILKKICDHPLLLTKRAAEDVLEGLDSMLTPEDAGVAEKLAMHVADVAERSDFQENHDNLSCKISFILSLLGNLIPEGHNVLIFSQTRKMLNLIQESLISNGYEFLRIDGTTKAPDRVKIVGEFQDGGGASIFLLTSQVGGLGLTLTNADRVIVVDPAWNPSTDNQSVDRAYRIGQKKDVIVYRLMTCGTVEEKIYRKQIFKGGLFRSATEHKEQIRYFSQQDLRELFSLPKQGFDVSLTQQQLHEEHDSQHKMDEFLEGHIKFLETQGIAGVSHHSLLFSKTAPVEVLQEEVKKRKMQAPYVRNSSTSSNSLDYNVEGGAAHAFNPKDMKLNKISSSPNSSGKLTESDIKERINRLSQILGNVVTVSRLPDQGARLRKQISELNLELEKLRKEKNAEKGILNLDDLAEELGAMNL